MISKKWVTFLNENKLSGDEFTICYLIYLSKVESIDDKFNEYLDNNKNKVDYALLFKTLEEKGFLQNLNRKGEFLVNKINVTKKFTEKLFIKIDVAWQDIVTLYPKRIEWQQDGKTKVVPTFGNIDKDKLSYQQFIEHRLDKHYEVVAILEQYLEKNGNKAVYKFINFLENYEAIKLLLEDMQTNSSGLDDDYVM